LIALKRAVKVMMCIGFRDGTKAQITIAMTTSNAELKNALVVESKIKSMLGYEIGSFRIDFPVEVNPTGRDVVAFATRIEQPMTTTFTDMQVSRFFDRNFYGLNCANL